MNFNSAYEQLRETLKTFVPPVEGQFPKGVTSQKNPIRSEIAPIVYAPFRLCNWPETRVSSIPEVKELNDEQKKLAELVCDVPGLPLDIFAIPQTVRARMRWLGREPEGLLEKEIEFTLQDKLHTAPLWKAAFITDGDVWKQLSLEQTLVAWGETVLGDYHIEPPIIPKRIGAAGKEWASEYADWLLSVFAPGTPHTERGQYDSPPAHVRYVISSALAQAGVPIEERWDQLFTLDLKSIRALPQARRDKVLIQLIGEERSRSYAAKVAMKAVKQFGTKELLKGLLKYLAKPSFKSLLTPGRQEILMQLKEQFEAKPELVSIIDLNLAKLQKSSQLSLSKVSNPEDVKKLTEVQKELLIRVGEDWQTNDGFIVQKNENNEITINSLQDLCFVEISDKDKEAYIAIIHDGENGVCMELSTSNIIGEFSQGSIRWKVKTPIAESLHYILRQAVGSAKK